MSLTETNDMKKTRRVSRWVDGRRKCVSSVKQPRRWSVLTTDYWRCKHFSLILYYWCFELWPTDVMPHIHFPRIRWTIMQIVRKIPIMLSVSHEYNNLIISSRWQILLPSTRHPFICLSWNLASDSLDRKNRQFVGKTSWVEHELRKKAGYGKSLWVPFR